ncbi:MAG: alpha-E domain-containing protein [Bacteroidota bacterium]
MLARVANSLYWTGRYIERSEHLARYLRVQYFSILDAPMSQNKDFILKSILTMYGMEFDSQEAVEEQKVLVEVGMDPDNPNSLFSTVRAARENARPVRYTVSSELWEVINQYYLFVKEYSVDFYKTRGLYDFSLQATKHCSIIRSYLNHTLLHDDIWVFIELGIHLERAAQIIRILSSKMTDINVVTENGSNIPLQRYQWTITLKVLEAFDMYKRTYRKAQKQSTVLEFLLTNSMFPRSIAYNLLYIKDLLSRLTFASEVKEPLFFKAGKLSSHFQYLEIKEIEGDVFQFLHDSLMDIYSLHELIEQKYFQTS